MQTVQTANPLFDIPTGKYVVDNIPTKEELLNGRSLLSYIQSYNPKSSFSVSQMGKQLTKIFDTDPDTVERYQAVAAYFVLGGYKVEFNGVDVPVIYWTDYEMQLVDMHEVIKNCISGPRHVAKENLFTDEFYEKIRNAAGEESSIVIDSFSKVE
ncbi:hypothetical protein PHABIO_14 [Pseudomonas phage Phabio]|uniref:Uncharacterized protein n=1 Tax=Pseudomonas phage Phabio TaxID=2006668 RepID=A0A1Y0SVY9_9CAUD|nr:hypothetical protein MZD05_gp014 [Pseudomonas phage Phabio]ARV76645.1 hypothetical protein PHABIO_14 [Pseudomonas phage Phabio]